MTTKRMTTSEMIVASRENFAKIDKIDPSSYAYKSLIILLNSLDQKGLRFVANADIKFVSALARNRLQ